MNCYKCAERIKTPNNDYAVAELIDMLRPFCIRCNPLEMPRGGHSQVAFNESAIGRTSPSEPADEADDDAQSADERAAFHLAPDFDRSPSDDATVLTPEAEDAVRKLLGIIATLDPNELQLFLCLLSGRSYSQIAPDLGVKSRQHVLYRVKQVAARHPWLNALRPSQSSKKVK